MPYERQLSEDTLESSGYLEACDIVEHAFRQALKMLKTIEKSVGSDRLQREGLQSAMETPALRSLGESELYEIYGRLNALAYHRYWHDRPESLIMALKHAARSIERLANAWDCLERGKNPAFYLRRAKAAALAVEDAMVGGGLLPSRGRASLARHLRRWWSGSLDTSPQIDWTQAQPRDHRQPDLPFSRGPEAAESGLPNGAEEAVGDAEDLVVCHHCGATFPSGSDAVVDEPEYESSHEGRPTCVYCGSYL